MTNPNRLRDSIADYLESKIRQELGGTPAKLDRQVNFMDLGLDSNTLIGMASAIEREVGVELYPTLFFEYQNVDELARYFAEEHASAFGNALAATTRSGYVNSTASTAAKMPAIHHEDDSAQSGAPEGRPLSQIRADSVAGKGDIAIIGMAGMFGGANDVEEFWDNIRDKVDLIRDIPIDHFDYRPWIGNSSAEEGLLYCSKGSFIGDIDRFDAEFFGVKQREAELMDPQLRKLLEVTYWTAESAGYVDRLKGSNTGMYVGVCFHDYQTEMMWDRKNIEVYDGIGNSATMLSNRPSHFFDLRGPSMTIDTACSSSLVALHQACDAVRNGECDKAIVAGVNLLLSPIHYRYFSRIGALSHSGRCHSFDERADGYVPGEGIAAVMIKLLREAERDGDPILGVVKGSAVTHCGYSSTITAPNVRGEADTIKKAWAAACIDPATISYIEAHGTGTKLGDPIEIQAIQKAFMDSGGRTNACYIGSAKAHVGHLEGAAGIAGVIKVLQSMRHGVIPVMPRFERLNPLIKLDQKLLAINTTPVAWRDVVPDGIYRAGVSSFGYGGTFSHVVLENYSIGNAETEQALTEVDGNGGGEDLIVLSARTQEQLNDRVTDLLVYLRRIARSNDVEMANGPRKKAGGRGGGERGHSGKWASLSAIAYTLQLCRQHFPTRIALVVSSLSGAIDALSTYLAGGKAGTSLYAGNGKVAVDLVQELAQDPELVKLVGHYVATKQRLRTVATLWVSGMDVNWRTMRSGSKSVLADLPLYPFKGESFWFKSRRVGVEEIIRIEEDVVKQGRLKAVKADFARLNDVLVSGVRSQLASMKVFPQGVPDTELMTQSDVLAKYKALLDELLNHAVGRRQAKQTDGGSQVDHQGSATVAPELDSSWRLELTRLSQASSDIRPYAVLALRCLDALPDVLRGVVPATDVLFPDGRGDLVAAIYKDNAVSDYFNDRLARTVDRIVETLAAHLPARKKITIVEVGAGTGSATLPILSVLSRYQDRIDYRYTDVSGALLSEFRNRYEDAYPGLSFSLWDVNRPASSDNLSGLKADIVVASNVLHATGDISNTLDNIRSILNRDGWLIISELTKNELFFSLTFGLLAGWWSFTDSARRLPGGPLLSETLWERELANGSYRDTTALCDPALGQNIIVAVGDGDVGTRANERAKGQRASSLKTPATIDHLHKDSYLEEIVEKVTMIVADMLRRAPKDIDRSAYFLDLGIDSINGIAMLRTINAAFGTGLEPVALLNQPTIEQFSRLLQSLMPNGNTAADYQPAEIDRKSKTLNRYEIDEALAYRLKAEKGLKSRTEIDKLFAGAEHRQYDILGLFRELVGEDRVTRHFIEGGNGLRIELFSAGDEAAEAVLLLPPLNSLSVIWYKQFAILSQRYRVLSIHYPGFGESEFYERNLDIEAIAAMIGRVVNNLGGHEGVHVVGWSMGGLLAQSIAEAGLLAVKSLTLIGTGTISMFDNDYYNEHTHVREVIRKEIINGVDVHDMLRRNEDILIATLNTRVLLHYAQIIRDFDHREPRNFAVPVLVLCGTDDQVLLPKYAKQLARLIKGAEYKEVQGGHFCALTDASSVNKRLVEFFEGVHRPMHAAARQTAVNVIAAQGTGL